MVSALLDESLASSALRIARRRVANSVLIALAVLPAGCRSIEFLTDNCTAESVLVSWPATITRGNTSTTVTLTGAVSPGNIDPSQFSLLKELLTTGGGGASASVVWTVPAFEVNGGYIAFLHKAPLTSGQTEPVDLAFDGGGWGIVSGRPEFPAVIAVRADNFVATSASGSITAIDGLPFDCASMSQRETRAMSPCDSRGKLSSDTNEPERIAASERVGSQKRRYADGRAGITLCRPSADSLPRA
jgi:hypothetical protein